MVTATDLKPLKWVSCLFFEVSQLNLPLKPVVKYNTNLSAVARPYLSALLGAFVLIAKLFVSITNITFIIFDIKLSFLAVLSG